MCEALTKLSNLEAEREALREEMRQRISLMIFDLAKEVRAYIPHENQKGVREELQRALSNLDNHEKNINYMIDELRKPVKDDEQKTVAA